MISLNPKFIFCVTLLLMSSAAMAGINPLDYHYENEEISLGGSTKGSAWGLLTLILFPICMWLVISDNSPMRSWADENKGLAYLFVFLSPCIPFIIAAMLH